MMTDTVYHLLATRKDIPPYLIEHFREKGFYRIGIQNAFKSDRSKEDFIYLWDIWFVVLFTWNETDYPTFNILVTKQSEPRSEHTEPISEEFSNSCFSHFKKGYLEGLQSFEAEINKTIGLFKKSDKNKKKAIVKLFEKLRKKIGFTSTIYPEKLEMAGRNHALYTKAFHLVEEYNLFKDEAIKGKKSWSYNTYAMALHMKGITLNKKGIGVNDGRDYPTLFDLASGVTLYNRLNKIEEISKPEKFEIKAKEVIEKHNL